MEISSFETLIIIVLFVLPGFIFDKIMRHFVPIRLESFSDKYVSFLFYSCCQYAVFGYPIYYLMDKEVIKDRPFIITLGIVFFVIILPILMSFLVIGIRESKLFPYIFNKVEVNPINFTPTSWDYIFNNQKKAIYVVVTCKDDTIIYGKYGVNSFASSDQSERDLFLETEYLVDEHGNWEQLGESKGILICKEEIKFVSFVEREEEIN